MLKHNIFFSYRIRFCSTNVSFSLNLFWSMKHIFYISFIGHFSIFSVILEDFYNLFICKRFRRQGENEVMIWQPCLFLRFAANYYHCHSS